MSGGFLTAIAAGDTQYIGFPMGNEHHRLARLDLDKLIHIERFRLVPNVVYAFVFLRDPEETLRRIASFGTSIESALVSDGPVVQPGLARQIVDLKITGSNPVGPAKIHLPIYSSGIFYWH